MWPKVLSWVALVCNALAVVFNVGLMAFTFAFEPAAQPAWGRLVGVVVVGAFLVSGPVITIFALLFGSPIARRYPVAPAPAAVFD